MMEMPDVIYVYPDADGEKGHDFIAYPKHPSVRYGGETEYHHSSVVEALLAETAIHLAARNSEIEQLRKETERLVRENEVFAERHKAWESCVYTVGLPVIHDVRDTEYGDAVPPVPVVNKVTDLLDECNKLRKERDELALFIRLNHDVVKVPDHIFLMCVRAKKVAGE